MYLYILLYVDPGLVTKQYASHLSDASPQRSCWGHVILKGVANSGKPFAPNNPIHIDMCISTFYFM